MAEPDPPPGLAAMAEQVAAMGVTLGEFQQVLGAQRGQLATADQRVDAIGQRMDDAEVDGLAARFARLAQLVADSLDAMSPDGPPLPRWDILEGGQRDLEVARLAKWVSRVLRPLYIDPADGPERGGYWLAECWRHHPAVVAELSWLAVYWRYIWDRPRPGPVKDAAEWHDRWLPGAMRRVMARLDGCRYEHQGGALADDAARRP